MTKRGQFYLIAAFVIIALIISFVAVTNYIISVNKDTVIDLKKELQIEGEQVINYGIISGISDELKQNLTSHFSAAFSERAEDKQIVFIYGNSEGEITAYQYVESEVGQVGIDLGSGISVEKIIGKSQSNVPMSKEEKKVTVNIANVSYDFNLQSGQNFYFIIIANEGGNVNVITA